MLRRHGTALRMSLMAADAASAGILFLLVSVSRFGSGWRDAWTSAGIDPVALGATYAVAWTLTLWLMGLYRLRARWSWKREWVDILRATLLVAVVSLAILFVAKLPNVSRIFLGQIFVAQAVVTIASRAVVRRLYARVRARGYNASFVLVIGDGRAARAFAARLTAHAQFGIRVAGFVRDPAAGAPAPGAPAQESARGDLQRTLDLPDARSILSEPSPRILGEIEDLPAILHGMVVDEVAICLPPEALAFLEPVARLCQDEGKIVRIPLDPVGLSLPGGIVDTFDGIPVLSLVHGPDRAVALLVNEPLTSSGRWRHSSCSRHSWWRRRWRSAWRMGGRSCIDRNGLACTAERFASSSSDRWFATPRSASPTSPPTTRSRATPSSSPTTLASPA